MAEDLLVIDGSQGEGGGQILRTSLALAMITGRPFRMVNVRGNRPKPGLRRQHLTAVRAAARVACAAITGDEVDSRELMFAPQSVKPGDYRFDIGSAGSTMLVLQTVLPALMLAAGPSTLVLEGGTHNFGAPPFPFLDKTFLPLLARMGPRVALSIERAGFAPRGGGRAVAQITPAPLRPIVLTRRGVVRRTEARAIIAGLPRDIAERELNVVRRLLGLRPEQLVVDELPPDQGPGNLVTVEVEAEHLTEVFTAFGARGEPAEDVAREAATEARRYLDRDVPVGEHLADQVLLPIALAGGGQFVTGPLTLHSTTNIETIRRFLDIAVAVEEAEKGTNHVRIGR
ncbi:MAG TPA: RNA 3'-terminal phosphate cyclase [Tepidisphaeraceae bacterium]|jgi:RNA 3'-terminal phosphate cyclase (ATP)